ncbi:DNA repair protein RecN, partial [bacterium]|nr:DNA repair protein RecN [bacterium]
DVHGQHEHQTLLKRKEQLNVLDNFANLFSLREKVSILYRQYVHQKGERDKLISSEEDRKRKIDFYQFEIEEINQAKLVLDEEEELEKEYRLLFNAQELSVLYSGVYEKLHEKEESILDLLKSVQKNLKEITRINCEVEDVLENVNNVFFELEEIGENVCEFKEKIKFDSPRLEEIVERKDLIIKLKRKYGDSIKKILEYKEKIEKELEQLLSYEENKEEVEKKIEKTKKELFELANNLSRQRQAAAKILEKRVKSQLRTLSMDKVRFVIDRKEDELNFSGLDRIEFLISPNVGEDLKPISLIASGGELSRIMLALKTVLADADAVPCLIFDEIDAGISGGVAKTIGEKLIELANIHQVICITHLPQIASFASVHFFVTKQVQKGRTETLVKKLAKQEKNNEIARMLEGDKVSALTLKHAEEMVEQARDKRKMKDDR